MIVCHGHRRVMTREVGLGLALCHQAGRETKFSAGSLVGGGAPRLRQERCRSTATQVHLFTLCDRIRHAGDMDADREIDLWRKPDIDIIPDTDPRYPNLLHEIPDPPGVLFRRGDCQPQNRWRWPSSGHVTPPTMVASGRASGCRFVAGRPDHRQRPGPRDRRGRAPRALEAGGRTIAVLGSGVLNIYPPEHAPLADTIRRQGAVLSELPPLQQPMSGTFPQGNGSQAINREGTTNQAEKNQTPRIRRGAGLGGGDGLFGLQRREGWVGGGWCNETLKMSAGIGLGAGGARNSSPQRRKEAIHFELVLVVG